MGEMAYVPEANDGKNLPLLIQGGNTVISCLSTTTRTDVRNILDYMAVLTVVNEVPPAGSFRPTYLGSGNKAAQWNKSQIDYSKLNKLPLVSGANLAYATGLLEKPMVNLGSQFKSNYFLGYYNTPIVGKNYGREITLGIARVGLELNLNYTNSEKELMAIRMIQHGLDYYGGILQGQQFIANGGHQAGRKLAMAMAGMLLNDAAILDRLDPVKYPGTFAEDTQHFFVTQQDIDAPRTGQHPLYPSEDPQPYTAAHLGMPEWGPAGGFPATDAGSNWGRIYRSTVCPNCAGEALAAIISGLDSAWKHPAFFAYYRNRAVPNYSASGNLDPFVKNMWDAYGAVMVVPPVDSPVSSFAVGDRIKLIRNTNVRISGATSATLLGTQVEGATGVIVSGPVMMDNIEWWEMNYDTGVDGWSGGDNFIKATSPVIPPSPPVGLRVVE